MLIQKRPVLDQLMPFVHPEDANSDYLISGNCYEWYAGIAYALKPKSILEIGTRRGYSLLAMLFGSGMTGPDEFCHYAPGSVEEVCVIDDESYGVTLDWIEDICLTKMPTTISKLIVVSNSQEMEKLTLRKNGLQRWDIIHVDGDHTEAGALHDLELAAEALAPGGTIILDDVVFYADVAKALTRFVAAHPGEWIVDRYPTFRGTALLTRVARVEQRSPLAHAETTLSNQTANAVGERVRSTTATQTVDSPVDGGTVPPLWITDNILSEEENRRFHELWLKLRASRVARVEQSSPLAHAETQLANQTANAVGERSSTTATQTQLERVTSSMFRPATFTQSQEAVVGTCNGHSTAERWEIETPRFADRIVEVIRSAWPEPFEHHILDFGCGCGRLSKAIKDRINWRVIGFDNSEAQCKLAAEYVGENFSYYSDLNVFPLGTAFCKVAVSIYVLQHIPAIELRDSIRAIHSALKPGGIFVYCGSDYRLAVTDRGFFDDRFCGVNVREEIARLFDEVGDLFPDIEKEHPLIRDIITAENCPPGSIAHPAKIYRKR